jgi:hypothetical protein
MARQNHTFVRLAKTEECATINDVTNLMKALDGRVISIETSQNQIDPDRINSASDV